MNRDAESVAAIACGGCGAKTSSDRCMGCFHDFGTPDSAWVQEYARALQEKDNG